MFSRRQAVLAFAERIIKNVHLLFSYVMALRFEPYNDSNICART